MNGTKCAMGFQNNKLRITTGNQWHAIWTVPFALIGLFLAIIWYDFNQYGIIAASVWGVADAFPTLYLHWQYYRQNKGEEYDIFTDRIVRSKGGEKQEFLVKNILLITVHLSPALYKGSQMHFLGIEAYYYACIHLKGGEQLLLTCLLDPKLDKTLKILEGVTIKRKKRVFNPLQWNYI